MRSQALKATPLDDDAFRLLALPFGGPANPAKFGLDPGLFPKGVDVDGQTYTERTDFKLDWFPFRLVDWHHRQDATSKADILGRAIDPETDDDGVWVKIWLDHGKRRVKLIQQLAEQGEVFGSAEAVPGTARLFSGKGTISWTRSTHGEIAVWPYMRQALSTSPQNTLSVIRPLKATLDDMAATGDAPTATFFDDLTTFLDTLGTSSETGKAGRIVAARNEARLREAREAMDESYFDPKRRRAAIAALDAVLEEINQFIIDS